MCIDLTHTTSKLAHVMGNSKMVAHHVYQLSRFRWTDYSLCGPLYISTRAQPASRHPGAVRAAAGKHPNGVWQDLDGASPATCSRELFP
jgi:hypothetical protein